MEGLPYLASNQHHTANVLDELRKDRNYNVRNIIIIACYRELDETNSDEFHSVGIGRFKLAEVMRPITITITISITISITIMNA